MTNEARLEDQRIALDKLKVGFNVSASSSDAAADAFNAVPVTERLPEVQAIVPKYNVVVAALKAAGQSIVGGIAAVDKAIAALPAPAPAPTPVPVEIPGGTVPFTAVNDYPTPEHINIYAPLNRPVVDGSKCLTHYRLKGTDAWFEAIPLHRSDLGAISYTVGNSNIDCFAGVIFFLTPGKEYEVLLTFKEPGHPDTSTILQTRTKALPAPSGPATVRATPKDDLNGVFKTMKAGDVLELANGVYERTDGNPHTFKLLGTPDKPIYIRGESKEGVIIRSAGGSTRALQGHGATNVIFETMTISAKQVVDWGTDRGVEFHDDGFHQDIWFREVHFDCTIAISSTSTTYGVIVYQCTGQGTMPWEQYILTKIGWNNYFVRLQGPGHCVFDCTIRGFGDTMHHREYDPTYANHCYRMKIRDCADDGIEFDYGLRNLSFHDIDLANSGSMISCDGTGTGPFYAFRIQCVNVLRGPEKLNSPISGLYIWNTTVVKRHGLTPAGKYLSGGTITQNYAHQNNLFIYYGIESRMLGWDSGPHDPVDFNHNGWNRDGGFEFCNSGVYATLDDYRKFSPLVRSLSGEMVHRMENDVILPYHPFTRETELTDDVIPFEIDWKLLLKEGSPGRNSGVRIPQITDGFTGALPDMGAHISGIEINVGYHGNAYKGSSQQPPPSTEIIAASTQRYLKLVITANNGDGGVTAIQEIEFRAKPGGLPYPKRSMTATASAEIAGYEASKMLNNSYRQVRDCWASENKFPLEVVIDLGAELSVAEIAIWAQSYDGGMARGPKEFTILKSADKKTWAKLSVVANATDYKMMEGKKFRIGDSSGSIPLPAL